MMKYNDREGRQLEFKQTVSNTFLKTVTAYANYSTGKILFGLDDDGVVVGIEKPREICLDIENKINDNIIPPPDFSLHIDEKNKVIELTVQEGDNKPYTYKGKAYKRNDSSTVEVDRTEYSRLVLEGKNLNFEELPSKQQDLTFNCLEKKFSSILGIEEITQDILKTLELYTNESGFNVAAALVSDKNSFPGIDIVRFGESIDTILDRETIESCSIFTQYDAAVTLFRKYYQYEKIEGMARKTIDLIPEKAFRETVVNALIHRTWDTKAHIRVEFYEDKIITTSPGGLPSGITEEEYLDGRISLLRNPILSTILFRLHLMEKFGTGVRRIKAAYRNSVLQPVFSITDNTIQVQLPALTSVPIMTMDETKIYEALAGGRQLSSSELAREIGFSRDKVIRLAASLLQKHYIKTQGNGRGTKYTLSR